MDRLPNVAVEIIAGLVTAVVSAVVLVVLARWRMLQRGAVRHPIKAAVASAGPHDARLVEAVGSALLRRTEPPVEALTRAAGLAPDGPSAAARLVRPLEILADPANSSLRARLLFIDEARELRGAATDARAALDPFLRLRADHARTDFTDMVTRITGAPVLVDATASKACVARDVAVWHRRTYRGDRQAATYEDAHRDGSCPPPADRDPGDYDGRVLELDQVRMVVDPARGGLVFLLTTSESCYYATERGDEATGCKHLTPESGADPFTRWVGGARSGSRIGLLTSYVSIMTSDDQLLLCRRSGLVNNGQKITSATAGGVCEPGGPGAGIDVDRHGFPDPVATAVREAHEELGVVLDRRALWPAAVWVANSLGWSMKNERWEGQVTPSLLCLARVAQRADEVRAIATHAGDLVHGAFEVERLDGVPLSDPGAIADHLAAHGADLDQHAVISLLYAARLRHGEKKLVPRLERVTEAQPWWQTGGPDGHRWWADPAVLAPSP